MLSSVCWGDILIKDGEYYDICVPPRDPEYLKQLVDDEKRLYDEGWYQPAIVGDYHQWPLEVLDERGAVCTEIIKEHKGYVLTASPDGEADCDFEHDEFCDAGPQW